MKPQRMFAMVVEDHIIEVAPTEARAYGKIHPVMVVPLAQWEAMERVIDEARNMTAAQDSECHLAAGAYASLMRLLVHALDATGAAAGKGE